MKVRREGDEIAPRRTHSSLASGRRPQQNYMKYSGYFDN